jgi:hypothetical protein
MLVSRSAAQLKHRERVMPKFEITMGGYDREQVDPLVTTVEAARDSRDPVPEFPIIASEVISEKEDRTLGL